MKHALLSASGSEKWLNCAGSINAEKNYEKVTSIYALEGTFAHELADLCLKNNVSAKSYLNETLTVFENQEPKNTTIKEEMVNYVQQYIDYVKKYETENSILYTERKVDFSNYAPGGYGTLDSAVYIPESKTLHIFDLKYGKGVKVYAKRNTQGMLYALGMLNELDGLDIIDDVYIHIIQPRVKLFTFYKTNKSELLLWGDYVLERANLALSENAPLTAGEKQCLWCLAKKECLTLKKYKSDVILPAFD